MWQRCYLHHSDPTQIMELLPPPALLRGVGNEPSRKIRGKIAMKTILSALVALSVITGVAGTASAFDTKTFYEQIDRDHN